MTNDRSDGTGDRRRAVLLCTDGSEASTSALAAGVELLGRDHPYVVVTVIDAPSAMLVTGGGHAGGVMTPDEYERLRETTLAEATAVLALTRRSLTLDDAGEHVLEGSPGPAICQYATETGARAIVMGSRGHGGLRRAVLGSVSDHVVRHAPCPVVVTN